MFERILKPSRLAITEASVFALLFLWLGASAVLVDIEYYDGFDSICNARYFAGWVETFEATRGPLFGLILLLPESIKESMGLHPLEVRPHHILFAILHAGYAMGCYVLASRMFTRGAAVLLAFVAAIPTFAFFSYAPFVSHDIVPGLLFLALLLGADAYLVRPRRGLWWTLVLIGAAAALIKHTYAIFWPIALIVAALAFVGSSPSAAPSPQSRGGRSSARKTLASRGIPLLALIGGALVSAVITILVLGWALKSTYFETPFFGRAFRQAKFLLFDAGVQIEQPAWVYLRNLPAFGFLVLMLFPIGVVKSWKESRRQRGLVVAWILSVAAVHLFSLHQVRYMLFLAPITMCLVVPAARTVLAKRWMMLSAFAILVLGVLPIHPYSIAREAARIGTEFYRRSEAKWFLQPLREDGRYRSPVYLNWGLLSFVPPGNSELPGDIYHRLFHLAPHHLIDLFPYDPDEVGYLDPQQLAMMPSWAASTVYLAATRPPQFNPINWRGGPASDKFEQEQLVFVSRTVVMHAAMTTDSTGIERPSWVADSMEVDIKIAMTEGGEPFSVLRSRAFPDRVPAVMPMRARIVREGNIYPMREVGPSQWAVPVAIPPIPPLEAVSPEPETIQLHYFEEVRRHENKD